MTPDPLISEAQAFALGTPQTLGKNGRGISVTAQKPYVGSIGTKLIEEE